ncbi:MAG TPA: thioredoxin domain-containing protein [Anaerolineales bacterium]|nr:thioredoxin domain-containing protein [Anaerolineales bacterium]
MSKSTESKYINRLIDQVSPYLLQHAHNPVDWYPWGEEALENARRENKPIFLSIGYSACHWCHRLAHESFEDPEVAAFMNEHFVNIKVDREERPDLDAIYMQATVAMTGSGGWPMSVFLTPDLKPFYAGTYFPPVRRYNMPAFRDVLAGIARTWKEDRAEVDRVSGQLSAHLQQALNINLKTEMTFTQEQLDTAAKSLVDNYDWENGGWGAAPKFPQPMAIEFLLRRASPSPAGRGLSEGQGEGENAPLTPHPSPWGRGELKVALHALKAMARGGMYDVVGGGFSRYSVDQFWRVPHFEKMLYDNAQLARAYLHAWQITGDEFFKRIVLETLGFIEREMTHPEGGFYSSLDADSEGEEGKFYVWTLEEIRDVLKDDSEFFEAAYGITARGNWEGKTVIQRALDDTSLAVRFKLDPETVPAKLAELHSKLLAARASRVRPGTDDKILTAWNGLMLATVAEAARVIVSPDSNQEIVSPRRRGDALSRSLGAARNDTYYELATRNAQFLLNSLRPDGKLKRSWREGKVTNEVFLEDYAALILGLIELYQTDFNNKWFSAAKDVADEMIELFNDPRGGFFDTAKDSEDLLLRPKDLQDNATPSGNALACEALLKLAAFTDDVRYRDLAEQSLGLVAGMASQYPTAFARWLSAADFALSNVKQVAVVSESDGHHTRELIQVIESTYRPNMIVAASPYPPSNEAPPLLMDRPLKNGQPTVYVCEGFVCKNPVTESSELEELL